MLGRYSRDSRPCDVNEHRVSDGAAKSGSSQGDGWIGLSCLRSSHGSKADTILIHIDTATHNKTNDPARQHHLLSGRSGIKSGGFHPHYRNRRRPGPDVKCGCSEGGAFHRAQGSKVHGMEAFLQFTCEGGHQGQAQAAHPHGTWERHSFTVGHTPKTEAIGCYSTDHN